MSGANGHSADNRLDELAKTLAAEEMPRRRALGRVATAMAGGLAAVFAGARPVAAAPPVRCQPGFTNCDGLCRDLLTNPDHCGGCGTACATNQLCRGGVCVTCTCVSGPTPCPPGQTACPNGTCVNLATDPANCGGCGIVCASGTCTDGRCSTFCEPGTIGGSCTVGVGACQRTGFLRCLPDGSGTICDAEPGQPTEEVCNGIDDDCDGQVDEGNPGGGAGCTTPEGAAGTTTCVNGQIICLAT